MNRYLKPARQDVPPPGGWPAVRWTRYIPTKGLRGAVLLAGVTLMSGYTIIGRFKENKMRSVTNMRRAEERGEQWKIMLKHFKFEDPNWRTKYYADAVRKFDETNPWLRSEIAKPIRSILDKDQWKLRGGWWYTKWHKQEHVDTADAAAHGAYNEMLALAKKRLRLREEHKRRLNVRDGYIPAERNRIAKEINVRNNPEKTGTNAWDYFTQSHHYVRDWYQSD